MFKNIVKIIALGVLGTAFSQSNLNSPYSSFGLGNEAPVNGAVHNSTGVGLAYSSSLFLNTQNPALLSRSHNVVFEYGVNLDANWINTKDQSGNSSSMNIHYFGMSVPVSRRLTSSLGFSPLYKKSFNYQDEQSFDNGNIISSTFTGKSSTNKIYLGNAYQLLSDTTRSFKLDLGVEPYFIFGSGEEEKLRSLNGASFSTGERTTTGVKGWGVKGGLSLRKQLMQYSVKVPSGVIESYGYNNVKKRITDNYKVKEGTYFVIFPSKKEIIFDSEITDLKAKKHIRSLLIYDKLKAEGIYVKIAAISATDKELLSELISLRSSVETDDISNKAVGAFYRQGSGVFLNSGFIYEAGSKLNLSIIEEQFVQNVASTADIDIDTILSNNINAYLPTTIGFGLGIEKPFAKGYHKDGTKRTGSWAVGVDLKLTNWSKTLEATNTTYIGIGGEIIPDAQNRNEKNSERNQFSKYLRRIVYRGGLNYSTLPYRIGNKEAVKLGIKFGVSLPVGTVRSYYRPKYLNIGFSYDQIGEVSKNGISEQLFRTTLSFTMNEKWFRKWKIGF